MKLKKGDVILYIEKQAIKNSRQVYKMLSSILKKQKKISVEIKRAEKRLLLIYHIQPYKNKKKILLAKIERLDKAGANLKKKNTPAETKKTLVPEKYKPYMQRAYVSSLNSFVYKASDFDSIKLYPLPIGKQILISKKIFRPPHNFGTFYKVFLFKETKLVGYISEAEVIPEFKRTGKNFKPNSSYKLARSYILNNKILNLDSIEEIKSSAKKRRADKRKKPIAYKQKYAGLSIGYMRPWPFITTDNHRGFIGLKLSGYKLSASYLNMDINLSSSFNWREFYVDILTAYPILKFPHYRLFIMGGLMGALSLNQNYRMDISSVDYGLAGALSLLAPLNENLAFKLDTKMTYHVRSQLINPLNFSASLSLQAAF